MLGNAKVFLASCMRKSIFIANLPTKNAGTFFIYIFGSSFSFFFGHEISKISNFVAKKCFKNYCFHIFLVEIREFPVSDV